MKSKIENFYKKKLANGLTVLFEKRKLPVVSVSASVRFGSAYEPMRINGVSHFIEHLMFKGTKKRSQKEIALEIEKKGGALNGFTSEEVTSYWCKIASKDCKLGLDIVSDLILNPKFDALEFEKEKKVIIEEIKMYHDNPVFYVLDKIKELLYKKPFGMSIAGKSEIIENLTRKEVVGLYSSNYTTDSMILCAVGNADFKDICEQAEEVYPARKRKIIEKIPEKINSEQSEERKGIDQAHFMFGFHVPSMRDEKKYAYEVGGAYLFEGMSSRLFQEIRQKRGLAYAIKGDFEIGKNYGYAAIYAGTTKEKIRQIKEIILKEIKGLKNLEKKDFEECKEQLIGMKKLAEEDSVNVMNALMMEEIGGNAEEYYKYEEKINSVSLNEVREIAKLKAYSSFTLVPA